MITGPSWQQWPGTRGFPKKKVDETPREGQTGGERVRGFNQCEIKGRPDQEIPRCVIPFMWCINLRGLP